MATLYKCPNIGNCDKADRGETISIAAGAPAQCPECGANLILAKGANVGGGAGGNGLAFVVLGLLLLLAVGFVGWWLWGRGDNKVVIAPPAAPAPPATPAPPVVVPETMLTPAPGAPASSQSVPAAPPQAAPAEPLQPPHRGKLESELESQFKSKSPVETELESALKHKPASTEKKP